MNSEVPVGRHVTDGGDGGAQLNDESNIIMRLLPRSATRIQSLAVTAKEHVSFNSRVFD